MNENTILTEALLASQCVISVIGNHAGEGVAAIFQRKIEDIQKINRTFWLIKSPKAKPTLVQKLCEKKSTYVLFVAPASQGGARPTEVAEKATEYSDDGLIWHALPAGLGPVTGKIYPHAFALVFDALATVHGTTVDLWSYADFANPEKPVKMILGCSTICATKKDTGNHSERLMSRFRKIVAVGRLTMPYCAYVR